MDKNFYPNFINKQVYIYCSGKSGSSTLYKTFAHEYFATAQIHHYEIFKTIVSGYNNNIFDYIDDSLNKFKDLYFIDSYRLPLERSISSFFQGIEKIVPDYKNKKIEELIDIYNNCHYENENYYSIDEILDYFKIEKFANLNNNFNYIKIIINGTNLHFILLKFSCINEWPTILSNIFNRKINLINDNRSEQKEYYYVYENFKKNYKINTNIINYFINDFHFQKYNSDVEKKEYIEYLNGLLISNDVEDND
jgi:hypothetical protein